MFPYLIRPIQPDKDAAAIADLVKVSFGPYLDQENVEYLSSLRREGLYAEAHPLLTRITQFPYKLDGVVCADHDGTLLGLISAYYFYLKAESCCLIANVCVKPDHRKQGIASEMLTEIERMQSAKGIRDIYLQARLAAPETIEFYRNHDFRVTDYRETWVRPVSRFDAAPVTGYRSERVPDADMPAFWRLFYGRYPETILWNLHYKESLFRPGFMADIRNRLDSPVNRFRRITDPSGRVMAWTAYQKLGGFADRLWLIPNEGLTAPEYRDVLQFSANDRNGKKPLQIDVPAGEDVNLYKAAGFRHMQTLAWMWKRI